MMATLPFGPGALTFIGLYLLSLLYLGWRGRQAQQENTLKDFYLAGRASRDTAATAGTGR